MEELRQNKGIGAGIKKPGAFAPGPIYSAFSMASITPSTLEVSTVSIRPLS